MQNEARTRELSDEMLSDMQQRGETPSLRDTMGAGEIDPQWAEQNPEKADELQKLRDEFTMTVGGMAGAGGGRGIAHDAIDAIKALRAAELGEDVVLAAERNLAEKSPMTLEEVQKLTRNLKPDCCTTSRRGAGVGYGAHARRAGAERSRRCPSPDSAGACRVSGRPVFRGRRDAARGCCSRVSAGGVPHGQRLGVRGQPGRHDHQEQGRSQ
jgi:hypothetical protein